MSIASLAQRLGMTEGQLYTSAITLAAAALLAVGLGDVHGVASGLAAQPLLPAAPVAGQPTVVVPARVPTVAAPGPLGVPPLIGVPAPEPAPWIGPPFEPGPPQVQPKPTPTKEPCDNAAVQHAGRDVILTLDATAGGQLPEKDLLAALGTVTGCDATDPALLALGLLVGAGQTLPDPGLPGLPPLPFVRVPDAVVGALQSARPAVDAVCGLVGTGNAVAHAVRLGLPGSDPAGRGPGDVPGARGVRSGEAAVSIESLLSRLTLEEKAYLTAGTDMWTVPGLPDHGIPSITMTDGPNGARGQALLGAGRVSAVCVPCGSALGATWDPALVEEVGGVLGEEAHTKGARILLAPTINLHRHPLGGRGFECYSEDPLLSGKVAAGFVRGVQSRGVAATAKHFVANEQEHERTTISSVVDERALRELYLLPFEIACKQAGLLCVMTSYNRVNGLWCSEDKGLLDTLRTDLAFDGVVMTDWFAVGSTVGSALAGLDLQMPGPDRFFGAPLAKAVADGDLDESVLDAIVRRWLRLIDRLGAWDDRPVVEQAVDLPEHREVARRAAAAGTVLLRNDGTLPLAPGGTVALVGPLAGRAHMMGGGSAQLRPHRTPSLLEVLQPQLGDRLTYARGCDIDKTVRPLVARGIRLELFDSLDRSGPVFATSVENDLKLLWFGSPEPGLDEDRFSFRATATLDVRDTGLHTFTLVQAGRARLLLDGEVVLDGVMSPPPSGTDFFGLGSEEIATTVELVAGTPVELVVEYSSMLSQYLHGVKIGHRPPPGDDPIAEAVGVAAAADVAVVVVGTSEEWESEGHDRKGMQLPGDQDELVRRVCAVNPRTVVVVCAGAPADMPWADEAAAVLLAWLGGQEVGHALDDVLFGRAEPSGRLPVTLPERIEHCPAYGSFPGENDEVVYREGLLAGYRWFDTRHLPVRFPFGHGGSYTTFDWGPVRLSSPTFGVGEELTVTVPVTNTGSRRGADVVQVYLRPQTSQLERPRTELRGFAKVWLDPGETREVMVVLTDRAFAYWDGGSGERSTLRERLGEGSIVPADQGPAPRTRAGWWVDEGPVEVVVGRSVVDVVELLSVEVVAGGLVDRGSCP